jgi:Trk K+ transport system NAD-binding subunit
MKYLMSSLMQTVRPGSRKIRLRLLGKFLLLLLSIIVAFSIAFHGLMLYEGREFSWFTGTYWTLTVMSTLGFGDITFETDLGRAFSVLVLLTGMLFLLVMLPFTFIEFFYSPWIKAQQEARAPRQVPDDMKNHVILTNPDSVSMALIQRLERYGSPYVLVENDIQKALEFREQGIRVVRADLRQPDGFHQLGLERAAMLVSTGADVTNTSEAFTARNLAPQLTIVATANSPDSVDVLSLAGCDHVIELGNLLGTALGRRTLGSDAQAHIIGSFDEIRIAEASAAGTPLCGKTLRDCKLRQRTGLTVVGMWERGFFQVPGPDTPITASTVLVLAGTEEEIARYNALMCIYHQSVGSVIIIGAGRVGRAAGRTLAEADIDFVIIDADPQKALPEKFLLGSAADFATLQKAGIENAPTVIITTRDDETNIYLTIYCRKLRPDLQILTRSTMESNAVRMHRAGADFVLSYASMGANILFNLLRKENVLMVAEGLNIFRVEMPPALVGLELQESGIRENTDCSVVAVRRRGTTLMSPRPDFRLEEEDELVLIGSLEAEEKFLELHRRAAG